MQVQYWALSSAPRLRGGRLSTATTPVALDYQGKADWAPSVMLSVPAGKQNTLRMSYFQAHGSGDQTAGTDLTLFSTGYTKGDLLTANYKLQSAKLSWDYLSYTFDSHRIRFKTLWEMQYARVQTSLDAPLRNTDEASYYATGEKQLFYPAFGIGLEQSPTRRFRWEARASGFGLPRRAALWDAEANAALRIRQAELLVGARAFQIKTSPRDDAYFRQTVAGPFFALRWYLDWYR